MRHAEQLGLIIGLENPGDGSDNLINTAADGIALLDTLGYPHLRLNYDAANTVSHRPPGRPAAWCSASLTRCSPCRTAGTCISRTPG